MDRAAKIDAAVAAGCELVGALETVGPINHEQARLIIVAAARGAKIPNLQSWEIWKAAERILEDVKGYKN